MKKLNIKFNIFIVNYTLIVLTLSACNINIPQKKSRYHLVKPGDTLYSIAKKYNVKLERLIKLNHIKVPHTLYSNQKIALPNKTTSTNKAYVTKKHTYHYTTQNPGQYNNKNWAWPAHGKIIKTFSTSGPNKLNGIDITGKKGDPIVSAFDGKVVYSGNNLRGYGNLIIIKHNQNFLSAYAHNDAILVKEQQTVIKGQQIATMGDSEANIVSLHFEVRYKGKPIDPLNVLSKK